MNMPTRLMNIHNYRCSDDSCYPSRFATYRLCACADSLFFFFFFTKGTFSCCNV